MELIQIIITSLKLFALISAIVVLISYAIYKLKERNRTKPYSEIHDPGLLNQNYATKEEIIEKKQVRFQILNNENLKTPAALNEEVFEKPKVKNYAPSNPLNYKKNLPKETFDIYDSYSNSNFEPMYKVKL